jgi:hypothetical protein
VKPAGRSTDVAQGAEKQLALLRGDDRETEPQAGVSADQPHVQRRDRIVERLRARVAQQREWAALAPVAVERLREPVEVLGGDSW